MIHNLLASSLIGGLYLVILFALSAAVCLFIRLCVYYYKSTKKKSPAPAVIPEPTVKKTIKKKPLKPRLPVNKIIIDPGAVNKIYVKQDDKRG